jgi:hypothetical protein
VGEISLYAVDINMGGTMSRTLLDVDDDALAAAMAMYGTTTKVETVNRALREAVARGTEQRSQDLVVLTEMARDMIEVDWNEAWRGAADHSRMRKDESRHGAA